MVLKSYTFTLAEVLEIRDALIEQHQRLRPAKGEAYSEGRAQHVRALSALADQFKQDALLIREA